MESTPLNASPGLDHLLYRRQFVLSTQSIYALSNSRQVLIGGRYHLSAHRDLELTHIEQTGKSLTLLGFMLDPDRPGDTNEQILQRLSGIAWRADKLDDSLGALGGRWVLITYDGIETNVLQDATGQRQVYYTRGVGRETSMCASEPGFMAECLGLTMAADAVDFIRSRPTDDYEIYWLPGDTSLFAEIAALLPNHRLSLTNGTVHRFSPVQALEPMSHPQALAECVRLLRGQVDSARRRYPLAIPMTAGWDSRLILALNQEHAEDLYAFTLAYPQLPADSRDVVIPSRLLGKLGIAHHVILYPKSIDSGFKETFRRNNVSANTAYCGDIQALHVHYPGERVCVTGDAAEIVKCYYERSHPQSESVSAIELAEFSRLGRHPFVVQAFAKWLESAASPGIDLIDLFCWEQMAGRWQSKVRAEYDMVQESFSPLNNRRLLSILLSVDPQSRRAPDFRFILELIETLWPEVLSEPINPPERLSRSRQVLNVIKKTGMLKLVPESTKRKLKEIFR